MDTVILAKVINVQLDAVDILRHDSHDLANDYVWSDLMTSATSGYYSVYMMSPTCGTFSMARSGRGGPTPLRGENQPEIFGLPNLRQLTKRRSEWAPFLEYGQRRWQI